MSINRSFISACRIPNCLQLRKAWQLDLVSTHKKLQLLYCNFSISFSDTEIWKTSLLRDYRRLLWVSIQLIAQLATEFLSNRKSTAAKPKSTREVISVPVTRYIDKYFCKKILEIELINLFSQILASVWKPKSIKTRSLLWHKKK